MKRKILISLIIFSFFSFIALALSIKIRVQVVDVSTTATKLPSSPLVGRKYIRIQNVGTETIYIGNSSVTADTSSTGGFQLKPYATWAADFTHNVDVYGIVASGTGKALVEEGK